MSQTCRKIYDRLLKQAVIETSDPRLVEEYGGNVNTARKWKPQDHENVIGFPEMCENPFMLKRKISKLEGKVAELESQLTLYRNLTKIVNINLKGRHVRDQEDREKILSEISKAAEHSKVSEILELTGLSLSRYKLWKAVRRPCLRTKGPNCAKRYPSQLTEKEIATMKELLLSEEHAHMRIKELHYYAKRNELLHCSCKTWYKYKEIFGWERARPKYKKKKKPKMGIRALGPNQIWHIDTSEIKIFNGRTYYLQAVRDNFSRYVLAWDIYSSKSGLKTVALIERAKANAVSMLKNAGQTFILADGGPENVNNRMSDYINDEKDIEMLIAGVHIKCTNAMIEMLWHALKHNHLYCLKIKNLRELKKEVAFYIQQHNEVIPRSAHEGGIPAELFLGTWSEKDKAELRNKAAVARKNRLAENSGRPCCIQA